MNEEEKIENKLARWIQGELSGEDVSDLKEEFDLDSFQQIDQSIKSFPMPPYDTDKSWIDLKSKIPTTPSRKFYSVKRRRVLWISGIAAGVAILTGLSLWIGQDDGEVIRSEYQSVSHILPGGSEIILAPSSQITYYPEDWVNTRKVTLKGSGYFNIVKGKQFVVGTSFGDVKVLGTKFSIQSAIASPEIKCFEGSVQVTNNAADSKILSPGDGISIINNELVEKKTYLKEAPWTKPSSSYKNENLETIILILEEIYNVKIEQSIGGNRVFSGTVIHNHLEDALLLVFEPLGLKYKIDEQIINIYE